MEERRICTTRRRRPVGAIPPTGPEYRVKSSVSIDPIVGSRSSFVTSFWRLISIELRGIGTTRRWCMVEAIPATRREYQLKRSVSKDLTVGSLLNFFPCFQRLFSMEFCGFRTTRRRRSVGAFPPPGLEYRLKRSVSKDLTVGSHLNFFTCFWRLFLMEVRGIGTTRRRCTVGVIPPIGLEYRLKRSVSKDPTVGSRSNFVTSFWRLISMELRGIGTTRRWCTVEAIPATRLEYQLKRSVSKDLTVGSLLNFFTCFRRLFSMEFCGFRTTRRRRSIGVFPPTRPEYRLKRSVSKDPTDGSYSNFFTCS